MSKEASTSASSGSSALSRSSISARIRRSFSRKDMAPSFTDRDPAPVRVCDSAPLPSFYPFGGGRYPACCAPT
ncbi:hypothetical protein GCM10022630_27680 [Thermobifida alba]